MVTLESAGPALAPEKPYVAVAQLVEHLIAIQKVASSNLVSHSDTYSVPPFQKDAYSNLFGIEKWLIQLSSTQSMWVQIPLPNHAS